MRFNPDRITGEQRAEQQARTLRRAMTIPERKLWKRVRDSRTGVKFRRQHPIGPYTADFYAAEIEFVIEIDGSMHDAARDAARDAYMAARGITVVRIAVWRLEQDFDHYVEMIRHRVKVMRASHEGDPP